VKEVEHSDNLSKLGMSHFKVVNVIGNALNSCNYDITPRASHIQLTAALRYIHDYMCMAITFVQTCWVPSFWFSISRYLCISRTPFASSSPFSFRI